CAATILETPLQVRSLSEPVDVRHPHSFPTRRSSDLFIDGDKIQRAIRTMRAARGAANAGVEGLVTVPGHHTDVADRRLHMVTDEDRKSTRLNSSHVKISYAVFCLKNKIRSHH